MWANGARRCLARARAGEHSREILVELGFDDGEIAELRNRNRDGLKETAMASEGRRIVWPIILIVVGLLFLASNLGYLHWAELRHLLATWWPLILIAIGLEQLARRVK